MKVRELQQILQDYHPDENIALLSLTSRYMQILGVNAEKTATDGMLVLSVDWSAKDKPVETEKEVLERQARLIQAAIDKIDEEDMRQAVGKVRRKSKERRTPAQQLLDGFIPTGGKKGRPRKIVTEVKQPKPKGRPRKNPLPDPNPEPLEIEKPCQFPDQSPEIFTF